MFINQVYLLILLVGILICNTSATEFNEQELKTHHIIAGITSKETLQSYIEKGELVRHEMNPYHINDTAICVPYTSTVNINEISPPLVKLCGEKDIFDLSAYDMNTITSKSIGKKNNMCVESTGADIYIDSIILDCAAGVNLNGNQIFINRATINTFSLNDLCILNTSRIDIQNSELYFGITQITVDQDISFIRSTYIIANSIDINTNVAELQILLSSSLEASSDIQIRGGLLTIEVAYIESNIGSIFIETTDRLEIAMFGDFTANNDLTLNSPNIALNIDSTLQASNLYINGNMLFYSVETTSIAANTLFSLNGPVSINGDTFISATFYSNYSIDSSDFTVFMSNTFEATDLLIEIMGNSNLITFRTMASLIVNNFYIVDQNAVPTNIITIENINIITFDDFSVVGYTLHFTDITNTSVTNDFVVSVESSIAMTVLTNLQIGGNLNLSTSDSVGAIDCIQIDNLDVSGSVFISSYRSIHINTLITVNVNFDINIQLFGDNELLEISTIYGSFTANTIDISTSFNPSTSNEVEMFGIHLMQVSFVTISTNSGNSFGGNVVNFVDIDTIVSIGWQINTDCDACDIKMNTINSFQVDSFNVQATFADVQLANINFYVLTGFNSQSIRLDIDTVLITEGAIDILVAEFTFTDCSINCIRFTLIGGGDIINSFFNVFSDDLRISTLTGSPTLNIYKTQMNGALDVYLQGDLRLLDSYFNVASTMYLNGTKLEFCSELRAFNIEFNHITTTLDCTYGAYSITTYDSIIDCTNLLTHKNITSIEQIRNLIISAPSINSNGKIIDPYSLILYTNLIDSGTANLTLTATVIEFHRYSGALINLITTDPLNDKFYIAAYDITIIHDSITSEYPGTIEGNLEIVLSTVAPPVSFSSPDPTYGLNGNFNIFGVFDQFICDEASNVIISGYNDPTIELFTNINRLEVKSNSSSEISPYTQSITKNSDDFSLYFGISELIFSNTWTLNIRINDNENYARLFADIVNFSSLISPPEIIINILDDSAIFDATPIFHVFLCSSPQANFGVIVFKDFISGDIIKDGDFITSGSGKYYQAKYFDDVDGFAYHSLSFMFSPDLPPTQTSTGTPTGTDSTTSTKSNSPTPTPTSTKSSSLSPTSTVSETQSPTTTKSKSIVPSIEPSDSPIPSGESFSSSPSFTPTTTKTVLVDIVPPLPLSKSPIPELITNTPSKSKMAQAETQNNNFQNPLPSPIIIPTAASFECLSCDVGSAKTVIAGSGNIEVPFNSNHGNTVGGIYFPETFNSDSENTIEINLVSNIQGQEVQNSNGDNVKLGNTIVDIIILDQFGNQVTKFSDPLTICLESSDSNEDECLGYYDTEKKEWICEDDCPEKDGGLVCGKTDHLTSFALLLQGGGNNGGKCDSSEDDYVFAWLSMALLIFAILIIVICVLLNEVRFRLIHQRKKRIMKLMAHHAENNEDLNY